MHTASTYKAFPEKALFAKWQKADSQARDMIWTTLWHVKYPLGIYYCNRILSGRPEADERAADITRNALCETLCAIEKKIQNDFNWEGVAKFHSYFNRTFYHFLSPLLRLETNYVRLELDLDVDEDLIAAVSTGSSLEVRSLVYSFLHFEKQLNEQHKEKLADVVHWIAEYIKCEVALLTKTYRNYTWETLPRADVRATDIELLLNDLISNGDTGIGRDAATKRFRLFLMKELFGFELTSERREEYCRLLGVEFTSRNGRVTQAKLESAYKKVTKSNLKNPVIEEAYKALSDSIRLRATLDQRLKRLKNELQSSPFI